MDESLPERGAGTQTLACCRNRRTARAKGPLPRLLRDGRRM